MNPDDVIANPSSYGQVYTTFPPALFKPATIIVRRSFKSISMAALTRKAMAEYIMKNHKEHEILDMIKEYDRIPLAEKGKHWY